MYVDDKSFDGTQKLTFGMDTNCVDADESMDDDCIEVKTRLM